MITHRCRTTLAALAVVLAVAGLTAASALASGPPIVETKVATAIGGTEATLNASITPNGATTKYYFEYGPTTSYGSRTEEAQILGNELKNVKKAVEHLSTVTTYHFRVVATNSNGTTNGTDQSFTTTTEKPEFVVNAGQKLSELKYSGAAGTSVWAAKNSSSFICEGVEVNGKATGSKTVNGKFVFKGCNSGSCKSPTGKEGEVVTEELQGTLVYIAKSAKTVGIVFRPQTGSALATFRCEGTVYRELRGSIIVPVGPPNLKRLGFEEKTLGLTGEGAQLITEYENGRGEKIHAGMEANWPSPEFWNALGWGVGEFFVNTNKEVEIQA
jgi:hypothetical protein